DDLSNWPCARRTWAGGLTENWVPIACLDRSRRVSRVRDVGTTNVSPTEFRGFPSFTGGRLTPLPSIMYTGQTFRFSESVIRLLASGATLLLLDQWSKRAVQLLTPRRFVTGVPFVYIRRVANLNKIYRSARALAAFVFVWLLAFASAVALHRSGIWFHGRVSQIGLGLAFGGAAGNMLDIVRQHSVVDF